MPWARTLQKRCAMGSLLVNFREHLLVPLGWISAEGLAGIVPDFSVGFQQSRSFEQFALMMPPSIRVVFYYFFDAMLWLYGLIALVGIFTFLISIFRVARLSKEHFKVSAGNVSLFRWLPFTHHGTSTTVPPTSEIEPAHLVSWREQL